MGLDKLIQIRPIVVEDPEKPSTVGNSPAAEGKTDKPLQKTLDEYSKISYEFEELKAEVARKRKDGTITEEEEGRLNVTAMKWLIKNAEIKKVLTKELKKRVDKGLKPSIAEAISKSDLSISSVAAFMHTDKSGNYIIPTKVLNKIGEDQIKFREGANKGVIEIETYKDNKFNNFGSIEFSRFRYGDEKYKDIIGYDAEIKYNFNFLRISTSDGAKPAEEGHYSLTIPSTDLGIWVDKYGKLSELQ